MAAVGVQDSSEAASRAARPPSGTTRCPKPASASVHSGGNGPPSPICTPRAWQRRLTCGGAPSSTSEPLPRGLRATSDGLRRPSADPRDTRASRGARGSPEGGSSPIRGCARPPPDPRQVTMSEAARQEKREQKARGSALGLSGVWKNDSNRGYRRTRRRTTLYGTLIGHVPDTFRTRSGHAGGQSSNLDACCFSPQTQQTTRHPARDICLEHTHTTSTTERAPGELAYRVKYIKNNAAACELDESAPLLYTKPRLSCSILNAFFKGQRAISPRA